MYNNNNFNYGGPMGPMGTTMYPQQKMIPEKSTLTPEQVKILQGSRNKKFSLQIPEEEFLRQTCNHQEYGLSRQADGSWVCNVCGESMIFTDYTKEDVQHHVNSIRNIINMIKIQDRIMPNNVRQEIFKIVAILEKLPDIAEMVFADSANAVNQSNIGRANLYGGNDVFRTMDMLTGGMNGMYQQEAPYGQPMNPNAVNMNPAGQAGFNPMNQQPNQGFNPMNQQPNQGFNPMNQQQVYGVNNQFQSQQNQGFNPMNQQQMMGNNSYQQQPSQAPYGNQFQQTHQDQPNYLDANDPVYKPQEQKSAPAPVAPKLENTSASLGGDAGIELDPNTGKPKKTV